MAQAPAPAPVDLLEPVAFAEEGGTVARRRQKRT